MKRRWIWTSICMMVILGSSACGSASETEEVSDVTQAIEVESTQEAETVMVVEDSNVVTAQNVMVAEKKDDIKEEKVIKTVKTTEAKNETNTGKEVAGASDGKVDEMDFAVVVNGMLIKIGDDINEMLSEVGEPDDFTEARSCLHDGNDRIYTYGGIVIYTYPNGKKDIVNIIEFQGDEKTLSGIGLGSTKAEIEAAYGSDYVEEFSFMTYMYRENATISFQMDGEECAYIEMYWE